MIENIKVRKAYSTLIQEVIRHCEEFDGPDLKIYGLTEESITNINELPMVIDFAKATIEYIRESYSPNWNDGGYFFWYHAGKMQEQVDILEPLAEKMMEAEEMDISEIIKQMKKPKVLPDGINYKKYDEIFEQLELPSIMFHYIFVCENILRLFISQVLDDNGYASIDSIGHSNLSKTIERQKNQETTQNYLPIRGDHDIYYLDLIYLNKVLQHEYTWNKCFKDKFKSQTWITERIESLYSIRCRVAHSSGYLTSDELKSVETYCREIIKQIDQYIN